VVNPAGSSPDSLDLVLNEVKAVKVAATAQIASLDAKAGFVLGSASFLAAAVSGLQGVVASHHTTHPTLLTLPLLVGGQSHPLVIGAVTVVQALSVVALAVYLYTVVAAWMAYRATTTYAVPAPRRLEAYLSRPDVVVKRAVVRALVEAYETIDAPMIQYKVTWTGRALRALLTEAVVSAILVVVGGVLIGAG